MRSNGHLCSCFANMPFLMMVGRGCVSRMSGHAPLARYLSPLDMYTDGSKQRIHAFSGQRQATHSGFPISTRRSDSASSTLLPKRVDGQLQTRVCYRPEIRTRFSCWRHSVRSPGGASETRGACVSCKTKREIYSLRGTARDTCVGRLISS